MPSRMRKRTSWGFGGSGGPGGTDEEEGRSETVPLLSDRAYDHHESGDTYQQQDDYAADHTITVIKEETSRKARKRALALEREREGDASEELERLPALLIRAVGAFTFAICAAATLGATKSGLYFGISIAECMIPVVIAVLWLMVELALSVVRVRRVMMGEESRRRRWIRRIRRRRRRLYLEQQIEAADSSSPFMSSSTPETMSPLESAAPSAASSRRPWSKRGKTRSRTRSRGGSGGNAASGHAAPEAAKAAPPTSREDSKDFFRAMSTRSDEESPSSENSSLREAQVAAAAAVAGVTQDSKAEEKQKEAAPVSRPRSISREGRLASAASAKKRRSKRHGTPNTMAEVATRAVRVSCLLQAWVRLWVSMVFFSLTGAVLMLLLLLRFAGGSSSMATGSLASPIIVALGLLALQSFLILDSDAGSGGGPAFRAGGARSSLALGRRPIIVLALISSVLLVYKFDAMARNNSGKGMSVLGMWIVEASWLVTLAPFWVIVSLVEAVYCRALLEDYMGENLSTTLFGGRTLGCLLLCWGDADDAWKCPGSLRSGGDRFYSSIRRRAELAPGQRAAAASLVGGILLLSIAVGAVASRLTRHGQGAWEVPVTILAAAVGCALAGIGLRRLAVAHDRAIRRDLPEPAKPLPVFYSEQEGGWVAGPPDPPTITIFLLGQVTLRQEGHISSRRVAGVEGEENEPVSC